jgi:hypothetical protein
MQIITVTGARWLNSLGDTDQFIASLQSALAGYGCSAGCPRLGRFAHTGEPRPGEVGGPTSGAAAQLSGERLNLTATKTLA